MTTETIDAALDPDRVGAEMYALMTELYPICRSITGAGLRQTLALIGEHIPLQVHEVPTGTEAYDWTVPREWNIRDAYVKNARGDKVIDFSESSLHVVNYSTPIQRKMSLAELRPHLFTLPDRPEWIPYRTSYYKESWGFCLSHNQFEQLEEGDYEVVIDSTLQDGSLSYGELYLPGKRAEEVLISAHACHPSMCNDNLSGVVLATFLAKHLQTIDTELSYRFVFGPGGIGSIVWLSRNEAVVPNIKHGLVAVCVGDPGDFTYKRSRQGNAMIDRAAINVLESMGGNYGVIDFSPYGYDERNYSAPAFDLPVGSLTRTTHACFPQYHTSGDDLSFVRPKSLGESVAAYQSILNVLDNDRTYLTLHPKCEPQLGKRGLYGLMGGLQDRDSKEVAMLWVLNFSDGRHSLLDISERSGIAFEDLRHASDLLHQHGLIKLMSEGDDPIGPGYATLPVK